MMTSRENMKTIIGIQTVAIFVLFVYAQIGTHQIQMPPSCDCQCTKKLHFSARNNDNSELLEEIEELKKQLKEAKEEREAAIAQPVEAQEPPHERSVEEVAEEHHDHVGDMKRYRKIIEAEDRQLDKELNANRTEVEDDPEDSPYQPEVEGDKDAWRPQFERLVPQPIDINPLINASSLQCHKENMTNLLLFYIYTAPQNFDQRRWIRETWGTVKEYNGYQIKSIFFIGNLVINKSHYLPQLVNESNHFGDLVQDRSYFDAYRNLTLKGISALKWVSTYCPNVYRVIKIDDDTQINPYNFVDFLKGQSSITMSELICKVTQGVGPIRNSKSKYYVSVAEYGPSYYPPYCQGYGYVFPPQVIPKLVQTFDVNRIIAMEDVYITGITGQSLGLRLHPLTAMYSTSFTSFEIFLERITTRPELLYVGHVHQKRYIDVFWHLAQQRKSFKDKEKKKKEDELKKQEIERRRVIETQQQMVNAKLHQMADEPEMS